MVPFLYRCPNTGTQVQAWTVDNPTDKLSMPAYRVYTIRDDGNFSNASEFIECADDKEAIEKAMQTMNGYALEIWDHGRLIARLPGRPPKT